MHANLRLVFLSISAVQLDFFANPRAEPPRKTETLPIVIENLL